MKENPNDLLDGATHDELSACIRLLAVSVVQHRAKSAFVSIDKSMTELRSGNDDDKGSGLFVEGKQVVEEALEMAKALASGDPLQAEEESEEDRSAAEKRSQLRIAVTAPIKVLWEGAKRPVEATLENISWGGAAVHVPEAKAGPGDTLRIILPSTNTGTIPVEASIIRVWELQDGKGDGMAVRFSSLSTRDEEELENVLELLMESGDTEGQRKHARLTQRLDIQFDDVEELQATLEDISAGGLGITVPDPLEIGQSFQAVISTLDERCSLKLRARVANQTPISFGSTDVYHVGLEFEHPSDELRERTEELVHEMAKMKFPKSRSPS